MSKVLPDFEQQELLLRLHQAADRLTIYNHMDAVIYLEDYRDFSMKSLQKIVDADDERRFIAKIKTTAPYYQALVNILLKKTDGEEKDSEYLLGTLMKQGDYENALKSIEARYGRALALLGPAAVETSNTFAPIAETSIEIPMADLVGGARVMRKKKDKGKISTPRLESGPADPLPGHGEALEKKVEGKTGGRFGPPKM